MLATKVEELKLTSAGAHEASRPSYSRRGSIVAAHFNIIPGEKAATKKRQQNEELRQEAQFLYQYFYQKIFNSLVHATRSNLDALRKALSPPSSVNYGEASDNRIDRQPVFSMQVTLAIPSIVVKPGLEDVQATVCEAVQVILAVHKQIPQWGPAEAVEPASTFAGQTLAAASQMLGAASQQMVGSEKKMEPRNFHKMVSENKEVIKLITTLSSIVNAAKKPVTESFDKFNCYQELWVTEQEPYLQEFMNGDPLLGDFEAKICHYEEVVTQVMEETDQLRVGAFCLDTGKGIPFSVQLAHSFFILVYSYPESGHHC